VCDVNAKTEVIAFDKDGRTVYCVDPVTLVLQTMLCGDQVDRASASRLSEMWLWVGKSFFGTGAFESFIWITESGLRFKAYDLDVKKEEASIREDDLLWLAQLHFDALRVEDRTEDNWHRMSTLYMALSQCVFLLPDHGGRMHMFWKGGNGQGGEPSGHLLTALDNSIFLIYLVVLGYVTECWKRNEDGSAAEFWHMHRGMGMGDDLRLTVSAEGEEWYRHSGRSPAEVIAQNVYDVIGVAFESVAWDGVPVMESKFCATQYYLMQEPVRWLTFKLDWERQLNALVQGGKLCHEHTAKGAIEQLGRINNLRIVTWPDKRNRCYVEGIRNSYIKRACVELPQLLDNPEWALTVNGWLEDGKLMKLYTGLILPTPIGEQSGSFASIIEDEWAES